MHAHSHAHDHPHAYHARTARLGRAFAIGIALNIAFVVAEVIGGLIANSLALVADAAHNFSDVVGLVLAWGAAALAQRPPSARFTYGFRGSTILAALANAMLLLVVTGGIAWEAVLRFKSPAALNETLMIWIAIIGIFINGGTAWLFMADRKTDLNVRGAYLHMAADAGVSLGVAIAGVGISVYRMAVAGRGGEPPDRRGHIHRHVGALARFGEARAARGAGKRRIPRRCGSYLAGVPGVAEVHDLHIWAMSTTETALTVHLVMPGGPSRR